MFWQRMTSALILSVAIAAGGVAQADDKDGKDQSVVQLGLEISPIPKDQLNFRGKDPYLVALGSYLVNGVADCGGCHSFPRYLPVGNASGSNPSAGNPYGSATAPTLPSDQSLKPGPVKANFNLPHFLAGGRCFGSAMSYNITPDSSGRPLGLTEDEFIRVMRTGEDVHCEKVQDQDPICTLALAPGTNPHVLQTMSWPTFHQMTDRDLKAIYAYLSAIPHAEACNTPDDGCALFSGFAKAQGLASGRYAYSDNAQGTCPINAAIHLPPPQ